MACTASVLDLVGYYGLTEEDCKRKVSSTDIVKIASAIHGKWDSKLDALLGLDPIVVTNVKEDYKCEEDGRLAFFKEWKQRKWFAATYHTLISALLEIECRQDAGRVCEILKETISAAPQDQASTSASATSSLVPTTPGMAPQNQTNICKKLSPTATQGQASGPTDTTPASSTSGNPPDTISAGLKITTGPWPLPKWSVTKNLDPP